MPRQLTACWPLPAGYPGWGLRRAGGVALRRSGKTRAARQIAICQQLAMPVCGARVSLVA